MTYPNLDEELRRSTAAQQQAFAANPVSSARAAQANPGTIEGSVAAQRQAFAESPVIPNAPNVSQRQRMGAITTAAGPIEYSTTAPGPVITAAAAAPRPQTQPLGNGDTAAQRAGFSDPRGNIGATQSVSVPQNTLDQMGNQQPYDPFGGIGEKAWRAGLQQQLDQYRARDAEAQMFRMQAQQNHLADVRARTGLEQAQEDAKFANWEAKNSVLGTTSGAAKKALLQQQAGAQARLLQAEKMAGQAGSAFPDAVKDPVRNAILAGELNNRIAVGDEAAKKNAAEIGLISKQAEAQGIKSKLEAEGLSQAKAMTSLYAKLTDPKASKTDKDAATKALLAMSGKNDVSGKTKVVPFKLPPKLDKFGNALDDGEAAFFVLNEDGSREVMLASDMAKKREDQKAK